MAVHILICAAEGRPLTEDVDYSFDQTRIVIGRGSSADIRIPHLTVSEVHATFHHQGDGYALVDNHSTNGTSINGARLVPGRGRKLKDGDRIDVGVYQLAFHSGVALTRSTTVERTAELARRLFRQCAAGARVGVPRIVVLTGAATGRSLEIPAPPSRLVIGRADHCQLVLGDPQVSREHAELFRDLDGVMIHNLSAKNGIEINEQLIGQRRLRDGDELSIGTTRLLFEDPAEEPMEALMAEPDHPMPPPGPEATPATPAERAPSVAPAAPAAPTSTIAPKPKEPRAAMRGTELAIYLLAALVIMLSVAGLLLLM
jgi:pSer/pThr/pTyr-binding forkhead associated (FHA) protein